MKKSKWYMLVLACNFWGTYCLSQNVAINEDGSAPNANAILDVKSSNKGILLPRITTAARLALPNTQGLLVYDMTAGSFFYNNGITWINIASTGWLLTGNSGTDSSNFLGTVDNLPLIIKVNNRHSGRIETRFGNTFWGYTAGASITSFVNIGLGRNNTGVGSDVLTATTTGNSNTAIGSSSLRTNTTGGENVAIGNDALLFNTTGRFNTAAGMSTLASNTTGWSNSAIGFQALADITGGSSNTAIGANALRFTTGERNTGLGATSDIPAGVNNAVAIGYGARANVSNKIRFGSIFITAIEGQVPYTTPSDGRFKFQVQEDVKGLDFILQLRPVTYQLEAKRFDEQLRGKNDPLNIPGLDDSAVYRSLVEKEMESGYKEASAIRRSGFIAQEVEKAANASGYNFSGLLKPQNEQDYYSLSYESFVVPLVKAIQEQQKIIADLKKQIDALKQQLSK